MIILFSRAVARQHNEQAGQCSYSNLSFELEPDCILGREEVHGRGGEDTKVLILHIYVFGWKQLI